MDELPHFISRTRLEVPRYVAEYPDNIKQIVLSIPTGIADFASIEYKDENKVLCVVNPERIYIEKILPINLSLYVLYVKGRDLWLEK